MPAPFCDHHISSFFAAYQGDKIPLDLALARYFKAHRSLGAHDRRTIGEAVYGIVRWKSLLEHLGPDEAPLQRLRRFQSLDLVAAQSDPSIPDSARLAVPEMLYERLTRDFSPAKARDLCRISNTPAPPTVRANLLKTTRDELIIRWAVHQPVPCPQASTGIRFPKRLPLFSFPEFKEGLFEMQDEGSQIVSSLVAAKPGETVLDFCSGSGGKSLAIAAGMKGRGQIYLHDVRPQALIEAKKRLRRAGVQNAQFLEPGHKQLSRLKDKCDWVLIDVPCTGTGTLRRNPDQKWRLSEAMLQRLVLEQRDIAARAVRYLKPEGRLVYATCSLLAEENQEQVAALLAAHPLALESPPLSLLPEEGGTDGFFAAVFKKMNPML